ncbi:TraR/DksA family transcriptional regulator [Dinoroseobacter sp. S375]|uniref:TraR/DksA family transcriptional regulator n=1 Tax=Dinoroseobacter sp. S375 TaxID=3415136 RepID=UPI003C7E9A65
MTDLMERQQALRARRRDLINRLRETRLSAEPRRQIREHGAGSPTFGPALSTQGTVRQLRRLQAALDRVADGRYGICMQCGGQISAARLNADPSTTLCASCKGEG